MSGMSTPAEEIKASNTRRTPVLRRRNNGRNEETQGGVVVMERPEERVDGWMEGRREGWRKEEEGRGGSTIREKFRPVKVSFLPIVLLIKTAPAPELIEELSPPRSHPLPRRSAFLTRQLVCEEGRK